MSQLFGVLLVIALFLSHGARSQTVVLPTASQLAYQQREIVALTHFNMGTYYGDADPSCNHHNWDKSGNPLNFNPYNLNISNWVESYLDVGAKSAVLTAKHGCGFCLWNTSVILPNTNTLYNYSSIFSSYPHDIIELFVNTLSSYNIGFGFYYSLTNNFYLNEYHHYIQNTTLLPGQQNVTQQQYQSIALQQLTELFTLYGNLTEFWFDGGTAMNNQISELIQKYQSNMAVFGGEAVTPNFIRWIGTESGIIRSPIWSLSDKNGVGNPNSTIFCPACCDTTLQEFDRWFYVKEDVLKTMDNLIQIYHSTVGNNGVLELDFAIDKTGNVAPNQAKRYKEFGNWIKKCYGIPINQTNNNIIKNKNGTILLEINTLNIIFDRFMIQEDLSKGQRIRVFTVNVNGNDIFTSTAIGQKRIVVLKNNMTSPAKIKFIANDFVGDQVYIVNFATFAPCSH